jgi:hypothetical protein
MTDQTRWGIDMVQQENKAKAYKEQKEMRDDLAFFVLNCGVYQLQKMTERMKQLKNENSKSNEKSMETIWCRCKIKSTFDK